MWKIAGLAETTILHRGICNIIKTIYNVYRQL